MSITVASEAPVAHITLDRPDALNALTAEMLDGLADALERLGTDPTISVIVLRGAGRAFSAGVDLKALGGRPLPGGAVGDVLDVPARRAIAAMGAAEAIVVAAIHGFCFTGALELALGCDVCIATTDAKFGDTHTKFGLRPSWGMSQRLPRAVGLPPRSLAHVHRAHVHRHGSRRLGTRCGRGAARRIRRRGRCARRHDQREQPCRAGGRQAPLRASSAELPLSDGLRHEAETAFPIADTEDRVASFR